MNTNMKPTAEDRPHHPLGPSSLQSVESCPCYMGRSGGSEAAIMGTRQHEATESRSEDHTLDDDRMLEVAECIDFYDSRVAALRQDFDVRFSAAGTFHKTPEMELVEIVEDYLPLDDDIYTLDCLDDKGNWFMSEVKGTTAGYIDRALVAPWIKYAEAMDWKFGAWPVEHPSNNLQGIAYALGIWRKHPQIETLTFYFKQPKLGVLAHHTWAKSDIPALTLRIKTVVARAREARRRRDFSMATPNIPTCLFCKRLGTCPKVAEMMIKVGRKFHSVEIPENLNASLVTDSRDISAGMRLAGLVKAWAEAFRSGVTNRIICGLADLPADQKIVSTVRRTVADANKFKAVALQFMTEAEYLATFTPEFGTTEKVVSAKAPRGQKTKAVEAFGEALEAAGAVKHSAPVVFLRAVATEEK